MYHWFCWLSNVESKPQNETQTKCVEGIDLVPILHPNILQLSKMDACLAAQVAGYLVILGCNIFFYVDVCVLLCVCVCVCCVHVPIIRLRNNV